MTEEDDKYDSIGDAKLCENCLTIVVDYAELKLGPAEEKSECCDEPNLIFLAGGNRIDVTDQEELLVSSI